MNDLTNSELILDFSNLTTAQIVDFLDSNNLIFGTIVLNAFDIDGICDIIVKCKIDRFYNIGWNYTNCIGVSTVDMRSFSVDDIYKRLHGAKLFKVTSTDNIT